jgi:hypothetical protein
MAMNNPDKFVISVSEELKGEFDDETKKNIPAHKITDKNDKYVYLGLSIGVVLGGIIVAITGVLLKWQVFSIFFGVIGGVVAGGLLGAGTAWVATRGKNKD